MTYFKIDGNINFELIKSLDNVKPSQYRSLIISRTSAIQFAIFFRQNERIGIPTVLFSCGLNVQMAINTEGLLLWVRPQFTQKDRG